MRYCLLLICSFVMLSACQAFRPSPRAQMAKLSNSSWRVETISGVAVVPDIESTLDVDAEGQVAGRGGCNPYVSNVGIEEGSIRFDKALAANIRCTPEQTDQEKRFFDALNAVRMIRVERDQLLLMDEKRATLLRLRRATLRIKIS